MPRENILDILQPEIHFGIEYHLLVSEYINMITDSLFYAEKKPIKKVALLFTIPM
jgi:hypothetical protein